MLREEILRLFERVARVLAQVAPHNQDAAELHAEILEALSAIKPVERLGVPFDI